MCLLTAPLTSSTVQSAVGLINQEFSSQPVLEQARIALPLSLCTQWLLRVLGLKKLKYSVVLDSGRVIAVSGCYAWRSQPGTAWVGWTVVHPTYRHQGIGSSLINGLRCQLLSEGYQQLCVYTSKSLAAQRFYESRGFQLRDSTQQIDFYSCSLDQTPKTKPANDSLENCLSPAGSRSIFLGGRR